MIKFIIFFYPPLLAVCLITYFINKKALDNRKILIGSIKAEWSTLFNFSLPFNWLRWLVVAAYLTWTIIWAVKIPAAKGPHFNLMLVVLLLSFSPRTQVCYGSQGIIFKMKVISWKNIKEKRIVNKGRKRFLVIKGASLISSSQKSIKIPLPARKPLSVRSKQ